MSKRLIHSNHTVVNDNQVVSLLDSQYSLDDGMKDINHELLEQSSTENSVVQESESEDLAEFFPSTPSYPSKKISSLGPFLLLKTLGIGEFGKVKLGKHVETGQIVAVKLVKKENIDSSSRLDKIRMEISILKTLNHPYIVKLICVNETNTNIGMVLEYAQGGELFEYIYKQRYLPEPEARRLFAQLVNCVNYMHKKNIVHRDLKLENILLDRHGNIIVTDFGFANQFTPKTGDLMSTACGSPVYAAPELVMTGRLYAGTGVDIWSCGIILFAMLCGYLPFDDDVKNPNGGNIDRLYRYIMSHKPRFPDHVSKDARDIVSQMLIPDPTKRCKIQNIIEHRWLSEYKELMSRSLEDLEQEAKSKKKRLLEGVASTTDLNTIIYDPKEGDEGDEGDDENCCDSTDHDSCSLASSVSSSCSYALSESNTKRTHHDDSLQDQQINKTKESNSPSLSTPTTPIPLSFRSNHISDQEKPETLLPSSASSLSSDSSDRQNIPSEQHKSILNSTVDNRKAADGIVPIVTSTNNITLSIPKTNPEINKRHTINAIPSSGLTQPVHDTPSLRRQHFSLKAKFLSSLKRHSSRHNASISTPSLVPEETHESSISKTKSAWHSVLHLNPKERPPITSTSTDSSRSEKIFSWIKKSKSNRPKKQMTFKGNSDSQDSFKTEAIPEDQAILPVAKRNEKSENESQTSISSLQKRDVPELRVHTGNMNHSVLTSKEPMDVLLQINKILLILGVEVKNQGGYLLHCVRPPIHAGVQKQTDSIDPMNHLATDYNNSHTITTQSIYGHPSLDNGEEIVFSVEICRFENLSGLFSVDIQCISCMDNLSAYQFIGQKLLSLLHFADIIRNTNFNLKMNQ